MFIGMWVAWVYTFVKINWSGGAWVAQWVKASAFVSGHDLRVLGSSHTGLSALRGACFLLSLCLPLCLFMISVYQVNK